MKRQMVLIASLVAGLIAALLTSAYISGKNAELKSKEAAMKRKYGEMVAVCFVSDKTKGSVINPEDLTTCNTFRRGNEGAVYTRDEMASLYGRRLFTGVKAKTPIRKTDIEGFQRDDGLATSIKQGYRAMSINVTGSASVSGMVRAGDEVDVIGTFSFPSDEGKNKRGDLATLTILQKITVLAVGEETARARVRSFGASSSSGFTTVTLLVTPREAEMLAVAEQTKGRLTLTLRNKNDITTESALPVVEFEKIREQTVELNRLRNPVGRKTR